MSNFTAAAEGGETVAARSSLWESIRRCGILGMGIDEEELRRKILIPTYIRRAMSSAIRNRDAGASAEAAVRAGEEADEVPEAPIVVFVNSRSGGRHGPQLTARLQQLISVEQVNEQVHFFSLLAFSTAFCEISFGIPEVEDRGWLTVAFSL